MPGRPQPVPDRPPAAGFPDGVRTAGLGEGLGDGLPAVPLVATAIHHGHELPSPFAEALCLDPATRLREEDPFTGDLIAGCPCQLVVTRSRFAGDLNRSRELTVYRDADEAWGLPLWRDRADAAVIAAGQAWHDRFYRAMGGLLDRMAARYPRFVLLDVHSYNHRRDGPRAAPTPAARAPDINLGTASMPTGQWDAMLEAIHQRVRTTPMSDGRILTIGNDIAFQGRGALTRFVHERHPRQGCAIAIEVKKVFMDEWTGQPDPAVIDSLRLLFSRLADDLLGLLQR